MARRTQAGAHRLPTGGSIVGLPWGLRGMWVARIWRPKGSDFEVATRRPEAAFTTTILGIWEKPPPVFILRGNRSFACGCLLISRKIYRNSPVHYETTCRKGVLSRPRVVIPILSWLSGVKGDCCLKLFKPCAVQLLCGFFDLFFKGVNVCLAEGEMIKRAKITGNKSVGYRSGENPYFRA